MRTIQSTKTIDIMPGCTVSVVARKVTVKGPRGELFKDLSHTSCEITQTDKQLTVTIWFGNRKEIACIRTLCTQIQNMMKGVISGYQFKMRSVYAHFPINLAIADDKKQIEIRNFLGEKRTRKIPMLEGVKVEMTENKDEIMLTGNSLENVSQSAASIQQSVAVKNKDIRKFLDGVYVSERGLIKAKE